MVNTRPYHVLTVEAPPVSAVMVRLNTAINNCSTAKSTCFHVTGMVLGWIMAVVGNIPSSKRSFVANTKHALPTMVGGTCRRCSSVHRSYQKQRHEVFQSNTFSNEYKNKTRYEKRYLEPNDPPILPFDIITIDRPHHQAMPKENTSTIRT